MMKDGIHRQNPLSAGMGDGVKVVMVLLGGKAVYIQQAGDGILAEVFTRRASTTYTQSSGFLLLYNSRSQSSSFQVPVPSQILKLVHARVDR